MRSTRATEQGRRRGAPLWRYLTAQDCDQAQGYPLHRPGARAEAGALLRRAEAAGTV